MIRILVMVILWVATLCVFDIEASWEDGLYIRFPGWLAAIIRRRKARVGRKEEGK